MFCLSIHRTPNASTKRQTYWNRRWNTCRTFTSSRIWTSIRAASHLPPASTSAWNKCSTSWNAFHWPTPPSTTTSCRRNCWHTWTSAGMSSPTKRRTKPLRSRSQILCRITACSTRLVTTFRWFSTRETTLRAYHQLLRCPLPRVRAQSSPRRPHPSPVTAPLPQAQPQTSPPLQTCVR